MRAARLPAIVRRRSGVHGYGVFAAETIAKNARIIDYAGELVRNGEECEAREAAYLKEGCIWVFRVNRAWSRDAAVGGNISRFHQPLLHAELLDLSEDRRRQDHLDARLANHPPRRRDHLRLLKVAFRRAHDSVPLPAGLSEHDLTSCWSLVAGPLVRYFCSETAVIGTMSRPGLPARGSTSEVISCQIAWISRGA